MQKEQMFLRKPLNTRLYQMTYEQEKIRSEYCTLPTMETCMSSWAFTEGKKQAQK